MRVTIKTENGNDMQVILKGASFQAVITELQALDWMDGLTANLPMNVACYVEPGEKLREWVVTRLDEPGKD